MERRNGRYVTKREFEHHHRTHVAPSLLKVDQIHEAIVGTVDKPGLAEKLRGVEGAQKRSRIAFWTAGAAAITVMVKSAWEAIRKS